MSYKVLDVISILDTLNTHLSEYNTCNNINKDKKNSTASLSAIFIKFIEGPKREKDYFKNINYFILFLFLIWIYPQRHSQDYDESFYTTNIRIR